MELITLVMKKLRSGLSSTLSTENKSQILQKRCPCIRAITPSKTKVDVIQTMFLEQINPRAYTQSHTPILVQGRRGVDGIPPSRF